MKTKEIRQLNDKQLSQLLKDLEFELIKIRSSGTIDEKKAKMKGVANPKEKTSLQREVKRTIAKILTILNERKNGK